MRGYIFLAISLFFAIYSQLIFKWKASLAGQFPNSGYQDQFFYFLKLILNPWIISAFISTILSGLYWFASISILELSKAYPFIGINFILMFYFGVYFFNENFTWSKFIGTLIVILGLIIISKN